MAKPKKPKYQESLEVKKYTKLTINLIAFNCPHCKKRILINETKN